MRTGLVDDPKYDEAWKPRAVASARVRKRMGEQE